MLYLNYCRTTNDAWWKKLLVVIAPIAFSVGISYTRLFLGVHSFNQTLFGILLGLWMAFTLEFCVRIPFERTVRSLVKCTAQPLWQYWVGITIAFVVAIVIQIITYAVIDSKVMILPEWTKNMVKKCGEKSIVEAFQGKTLLQVGYVSLGFGSYFGVIL